MNTAQIYAGGDWYANPIEQPAITADQFITQHADLIGLDEDLLDERLRERLPLQPIAYRSLQDGLTLLGVLLATSLATVEAHYALLLRGDEIIGLVCVNRNDALPGEPPADYLAADCLDLRYLSSRILDAGATRLLLVTSRPARRHYWMRRRPRLLVN
jgi:hypothetical protein